MRQTDPFVQYCAERQIKRTKDWRPTNKTHQRLREKPPQHTMVRGVVAIVMSYLAECLWLVRLNGQPTIVHELECSGLISKDFHYHNLS